MTSTARLITSTLVGILVFSLASIAAAKEPTTIPINIGFGPAFYYPTGAIQDEQAPHYGVHLYLKAIISQKLIKKKKKKIPKKLRGVASKIKEARVGHMLIPDSLFISPRVENTAIYGATWRLLGIDIPLIRKPRFAVGTGLLVTYAHISTEFADQEAETDSPVPKGSTNFFRPGADLRVELEIPLTKSFLISGGWSSAFYVPQELHGDFASMGDGKKRLWHIGQAYALIHFRIPYKTKI